jgi:hypothetical protein
MAARAASSKGVRRSGTKGALAPDPRDALDHLRVCATTGAGTLMHGTDSKEPADERDWLQLQSGSRSLTLMDVPPRCAPPR